MYINWPIAAARIVLKINPFPFSLEKLSSEIKSKIKIKLTYLYS